MVFAHFLAQINFGIIPSIATIIGLLMTGWGVIYAWRKAKPEASHILIEAASDVVVIQKDYIEKQEETIKNLHISLEDAHNEVKLCASRIDKLNKDIEVLRNQISK
jgi:peptidoglycan hydrolase CwlO-like protein